MKYLFVISLTELMLKREKHCQTWMLLYVAVTRSRRVTTSLCMHTNHTVIITCSKNYASYLKKTFCASATPQLFFWGMCAEQIHFSVLVIYSGYCWIVGDISHSLACNMAHRVFWVLEEMWVCHVNRNATIVCLFETPMNTNECFHFMCFLSHCGSVFRQSATEITSGKAGANFLVEHT